MGARASGTAEIGEDMTDNRPLSQPSVDADDRRAHLGFIQSAITRMSAASSSAKGWLLPVVTAAYGYALVKHAAPVALLGIGSSLLFACLDANYLRQEKQFRCLYNAAAKGESHVATFSLQASDLPPDTLTKDKGDWPATMPDWLNCWLPGPSVWLSWSVLPFYLPIVAFGVVIAIVV